MRFEIGEFWNEKWIIEENYVKPGLGFKTIESVDLNKTLSKIYSKTGVKLSRNFYLSYLIYKNDRYVDEISYDEFSQYSAINLISIENRRRRTTDFHIKDCEHGHMR